MTEKPGGGSTLHFAVASGSHETARVLLEHGCDPFRENASGMHESGENR
jgi:ankyrin repeat protein